MTKLKRCVESNLESKKLEKNNPQNFKTTLQNRSILKKKKIMQT